MRAETVSAISLVLLLPLTMLSGVKSACNYYQHLEPGQSYYIYNPEYPNPYRGENYCVWRLTSPYIIKFDCNLDMPRSYICSKENLSVKFDGEGAYRSCGKDTLNVSGMNATVRLDTVYYTKGGTFLCKVQSDKPFNEYNCQCGWRNSIKPWTAIVGGEETGVNEFPMMAGLVDSKLRMLYCGATIISNQYVVTAAHCVEGRDINNLGVVVGEHDVTTSDETKVTRLFRISSCIIHPYYADNQNDIAVCKIIGIINYSSEIGPVCLPFQHYRDSFGGAIVTALGWGLTEFGGAKATKLQKVNLNVINEMQCKRNYSDINSNHICTYTPGKDSCQMDSGGPVLWQNPTTHNLILIGITAAGIGCGSAPAIDVRVGAYVNWIMSVTPDVQYCKVE